MIEPATDNFFVGVCKYKYVSINMYLYIGTIIINQ